MPPSIIMCVDDEPSVLTLLRHLLDNMADDTVVEVAESGQEALDICADLRQDGREISVVVSDYIMPTMRGDEFLIQLHKISPRTTKIMLTGQSDLPGIKRTINEANLFRFLEKPVSNTDFVLTTKTGLQAYKAERDLEQRNEDLSAANSHLHAEVTARRATQLALQESLESLRLSERVLEGRVTERTAELANTIDHLRQTRFELLQAEKLAGLGSLVTGVAHELNTPIGIAVTTASALEGRSNELLAKLESGLIKKSTLTDFFERNAAGNQLIVNSCQRAAKLIESFKQVAVDRTSEDCRRFDLRDLVESNLATLRSNLKQSPWRIESGVPAGINCNSYPGPLGQVITNLIQNAITHGFKARDSGRITITAALKSDRVEIVIADDGQGMEPEVLEHIFEPFYTTRLGQGGSGLGLTISRNIMTGLIGGTLSATSKPGSGAVFTISMPLTAPGRPLRGGDLADA